MVNGSSVDPGITAAACESDQGVVLDSLGTTTSAPHRVQSALSLVCGVGHG